ncbi:MAG TPA: squalene synthase HpnC [Solirubrobacteraceae bacterium]|nr:squalene synthase HpnC [Solirubrobacteraceae bacterium]
MTATAPDAPRAAGVAALPTREQVLPQAGSENFTVASRLLGRRRARHLMAIYGFARLVDDVGDEAPGDRLALLDVVSAELHRAVSHRTSDPPQHPLMRDLAETVRECRLPIGPFERLIEANRTDQRVTRYETFGALLDYCQLSAAPVGELVLGVFDAATPRRVALSDRVCAGLQVVEHLQDIAEDHARGRVYMPREDLDRFGCGEADLAGADTPSASLRALIVFEATRARALLGSGGPLARTLPPAPRLAVAGFTAGGARALDRLDRRPAGRSAFLWTLLRTAGGR